MASSMEQMNQVMPVAPRETRLDKEDAIMLNISHLETENVIPLNGTGNYNPNDQIEFHYTSGEAIDWTSTYLKVRFEADASCCLQSAHSLIKQVEVYHDEQSLVERFNSIGPIINSTILASEATKDWIETEGGAFMATYLKYFNPENVLTPADVSNAQPHNATQSTREYVIPLCFLHPFFGSVSSKLYPILGSRIRLVFRLNEVNDVLSIKAGANDSYIVKDVELCVQKVVLEPEYKQEIMATIRSGAGYKCDFIDIQEVKVAPKQASAEIHSVENQFSNLLTIGVVRKPPVLNVSALTDKNTYPAFRAPLAGDVDKLMVTSGSRSFTNGSKGAKQSDLYALFEKASSSLCNIAGTTGFLDYRGFYDKTYGFSPLLVSTEKYNMGDLDTTIVNRGLSALDIGVTSKIDIEMTMNANLGANDELYFLLFHQKRIHWGPQGLRVIR